MTAPVLLSDKRTSGTAMLFSVAMHACVVIGLIQYSTHPSLGKPRLENRNSYLPIEVMLLSAAPTPEAIATANEERDKRSKPAKQKPPLEDVSASPHENRPASRSDSLSEPKTSTDIASEVHNDMAHVEASKSNTEVGTSSQLNQAIVRPVERRKDSESSQLSHPDYIYSPQPDYPMLLREQGVGGVVWLRVLVDNEGRAVEVNLAKSSGYRLLDEAALHAVRRWRFMPSKSGNQTLASWVEFPVRFTLNS